MNTDIEHIEGEYKSRLQEFLNAGNSLTVADLLGLSVSLFNDIKISDIARDDGDTLLCQWGIYDWGDKFQWGDGVQGGRYFSFDVTRQFLLPNNDEPYQLSFTLVYEPEPFQDCKDGNLWYPGDVPEIKQWVEKIQASAICQLAPNVPIKTFKIDFYEC